MHGEWAASSNDSEIGTGYTLDQFFKGRFLPGRSDLTKQTIDFYNNMWKHIPQEWKDAELAEQPHSVNQKYILTLSPGTARHIIKTYRAVPRAAWYGDLLPKEPLVKPFRYPRRTKPKLEVWGAREVIYAIEHIRGDTLYAMFLRAFGGGVRREEGIVLDWEDIESEKLASEDEQVNWLSRLKIFSAVTEVDGEKGTKNDTSYRIVKLSPSIANLLRKVAKETGPVLFSRNRCRMSASQTPKHWRALFDE